MSPAEIAARADRLAATVAGEPAYGHTRDVVVVHNGREVPARHFGDASADELVDTYSMTKSFVATLVGIALEHGTLTSLDEPVSRYLPDARHRYTLRHLLTMTAGTEAGGAWEIDEVMARPSGWVDWILTAPSKREPGAAFGYDNGSIHVPGQSLTVIPELGLVAVTVGDEARLRTGWRNARHAVL